MQKHKYEIGMDEFVDENGYFDEWLYSEALFERNIKRASFFYGVFSFLFAIFIFRQDPWMFFFTISVSIMAFIVNLSYVIILSKNKSFCKMMDLHKRLKKVPEHIKQNAQIHYPKNWRECAVECYECHISGDCLLCGAE